MVCNKCGTETLTDGAVYCPACGSRLDGKIQCHNCNQFNDGTNAFCIFCGTRIDGKTVCNTCGELVEGAFCAHCGTAVASTPKATKNKATEKPVDPNKQKRWDKVFGLTTGGVALAGAVFALIFVFLIGFIAKVVGSEEAVEGLASTEKITIYHFFGDAYKEISDFKASTKDMLCGELLVGDMYLYTIVCTVLAVATIACVVGFAIPAVISYVKYATGKTEKVNSKWALLTIFSFLGGLGMLYAQNFTSAKVVSGSEAAKIVIKTNGASVAGVVLCTIFAALWFAGKLVSYGKEWKNKAFIKKAVCVAVSACLVSALLAIWQQVSLGVTITTKYYLGGVLYDAGEMTTNFSPALHNSYFVAMTESMLEERIYQYESKLMAFYVCNVIMVFISIGGVACLIASLQSRVLATEGKEYAGLIFGIITFALTAVVLVLFIIMQVNMQAIFDAALEGDTDEIVKISYGYGTCIAAMILAALNLAVSITQTVFKKQKTE